MFPFSIGAMKLTSFPCTLYLQKKAIVNIVEKKGKRMQQKRETCFAWNYVVTCSFNGIYNQLTEFFGLCWLWYRPSFSLSFGVFEARAIA